ncbi:hypothetical protein [Hyalangium gracile]|uniref:hypothetical protein n=1 Tax=Hyalangium gracile TaxID=394092 RepID=UPI001CC97776|nr:hypothetical protein [Hyalangium gracile]
MKIDDIDGRTAIKSWLAGIPKPDQVLRRQDDGCYALFWKNPSLAEAPAHIVIDVHYTDTGYVLGHCFVKGWEGQLDMDDTEFSAKVAGIVPKKSPHGRWPDDPTHTITGGWGPKVPGNPNWTFREH